MVFLLLSGFTGQAQAQVQFDLCIRLYHDLIDAKPTNGDDFLINNNIAKKARGMYFEVSSSPTFDALTIEDFGWMDENTGCAEVNVPAGSYYLRGKSQQIFFLSGHEILVADPNNGLYEVTTSNPFTPTANSTYTLYLDAATPGLEWVNLSVVAGATIYRLKDEVPADLSYTIYWADNPTTNHSAYAQESPDGPAVYISDNTFPDHVRRKYIISHELGHNIFHYANWALETYPNPNPLNVELYRIASDYDALDDSDCDDDLSSGHSITSKEYQSAAASEGFADYISAISFNDTSVWSNFPGSGKSGICRIEPNYGVQWFPGISAFGAFSCEGNEGIDPGGAEAAYADARDYFGDWCADGTTANRGTQYDWLRFLWDMEAELGFSNVLEAMTGANPHTWNVDDTGNASDMPATRVENSFTNLGFTTEWNTEGPSNGVDR